VSERTGRLLFRILLEGKVKIDGAAIEKESLLNRSNKEYEKVLVRISRVFLQ